MTSSGPDAAGRKQRRLRNYLLDPKFQLKYTGYLVGIALALSLALGAALWMTSAAVLAQSHMAVSQGEQAVGLGEQAVGQGQRLVKLGEQVLKESQKVSKVVEMNIIKEYSDEPELAKVFKDEAKKRDAKLASQQKELEAQAAKLKARAKELNERADELKRQSAVISGQQTTMFVVLIVALSLLVLAIGAAGILVTHRVAGPIFKMKKQLREVGDGKLKVPAPLRKGDELVDFFDTFSSMVQSLRQRQQVEIAELEGAIDTLEKDVEEEKVKPFRELLGRMKDALEV